MATINLRPWREEKAQQRQKQFGLNALGAAIFAGVVVFAIGFYFDFMKDRQSDRNKYLKSETAKLDKKIAEIRELKAKRDQLIARMNTIQSLQGTRPLIVRNFDELVRVLPDGMYYSSLSRSGNSINIKGVAEDNWNVSTLMRNLEDSIWFGEPSLSNVGKKAENAYSFNLKVPIAKPKSGGGGK